VITRGFILQASYRTVPQPGGGAIPVVHLYGRLEQGGTFLIRDDRERPRFYIRAGDAQRARELGAPSPQPGDWRTLDGEAAAGIEVQTPPLVPPLRERLEQAGIATFEADVRFAQRFLLQRGIKGGCEIEGEPGNSPDFTHVFENPQLQPARVDVIPRVLSFDIETDRKAARLLAISLHGCGLDEVLIVDGSARPMPDRAIRCPDERAALAAFCERVRATDPDVLTGWNIVDFDLSVLERIAQRLRQPFILGREAGSLRIRKPQGYFGSGQASIPGRLVLDGIDLLRGAFVRMEDYSLDAVARVVLGEGKAVKGDARERIEEIEHNYRHDLPAFALYARTDARLAHDIVSRLDLVRLAFARSQLTGMTPDRVAASIASFDFVYLSELGRLRRVAPTVQGGDARVHVAQQGGQVLAPVPGLHRDVLVFDFRSLYPSLIRTFNIDPVSFVAEPGEHEDLIRMAGAAFRREPAILPRMLDELFPRRVAAQKAGDTVASNAIKILMNSFYGVLGTPACRFYNPALANAITGAGRQMLLWAKDWLERAGGTVLYGDTDSLFAACGTDTAQALLARGEALAAALTAELASHIKERWGVTSRLTLRFEKLYLRLFLPPARHSTQGASKRYAGLKQGRERTELELIGMEAVRSDWTALARQVQRELYRRWFNDEPLADYLAQVVQDVRQGRMDELLVYRKSLRKSAAEYTATTPPHVAAARKSGATDARSVRYLMTTAGPEAVGHVGHPLDREHYVRKQVRPVAEPVLATLGLEFEEVIGDQRQLRMF
jgi:DNA polymerase-2